MHFKLFSLFKKNGVQTFWLIFIITYGICFSLSAQVYQDHFGTGNNIGISVSSSSAEGQDSAALTLSGTGHFVDLAGASRFLAQAGFGGNYEEIEYASQIGIETWLEEQFAMAPSSYLTAYKATYTEVVSRLLAVHTTTDATDIERNRAYADFVFWTKVFKDADVLRNKAAFALNQIFVVSTASIKLKGKGYGATNYYDVLYEGAFGNFRDMLGEVTMHTLMGFYLSHFQNQKGDITLGTLPDENFAREIMQLFTIGLFELNNDGSYKLDAQGERIPTYNIVDIQELAKVFTGLSGGAWDLEAFPQFAGQPLTFDHNLNRYDLTVPMIMWEEHHEPGTKVMLDGTVIPAGQSGMEDINDALDILFNHPNVGPFIAFRLIQQLVKSNPTPAYINRVATSFNNNGQGVRGDMKAVFKAILSDPEARNCSWIEETKTGKLRQPLERFAAICRAFDVDSPSGDLWMSDFSNLRDQVEQIFMGAPTVFNFFTPFYAEDEFVAPNELVSPEFQILHSVTSIHYLNLMEDAIKNEPFRNFTSVNSNSPKLTDNGSDAPFLDFSAEIAILENNGVSALLDRLDLLICHGELSAGTKTIIKNTLDALVSRNFSSEDIVKNALYFIVISADYTILK